MSYAIIATIWSTVASVNTAAFAVGEGWIHLAMAILATLLVLSNAWLGRD